jgi:Na+-transporting methylmalonyl-CoA/oxaloacetate decarboxylase gamma subunit
MDSITAYIGNIVSTVIIVFFILIVFSIAVSVFLTTFEKSGKKEKEEGNSNNDIPFSC